MSDDFPGIEPMRHFLGFKFGCDAQRMAVFDPNGDPIGITIKIGDYPVMMLPVVPIPDGAIRFDEDPVG